MLHSPRALVRAVGLVATIALLTTACSGLPGSGSHTDADATSAIPLAEAEVLDDPRAWNGATHASLTEQAVDPISDTTPEPRLPVTVTDSQGTTVTVEDTSRILALDIYGTISTTVFNLGLGSSVVGRDISTQFTEASDLPLVTGTGHELVAEKILELDPTLILTDTSLGPWDVVLQMRDAGIPVVVVDSERSLDNVGPLTMEIATALGVPEQGERLAERTETEIDEVEAEIAKVAPASEQTRLRTVFLYVRGQAGVYYMFGEESGADSLITALGGYDVAAEIKWNGMKPVTDEGIISAQPELVLMMTKGLESAGGVDGLLERLPALAQTPAGQNRRFVDMTDSAILGYGPRTAEVLNSLAVAIYAPESAEPSFGEDGAE
ncbi:iron complex transport system substrate-binding protein [Nocardioides sp. YR527]|uniref:heme/hemin ABC transporter substrate-binding protein n=1 Tax=Nocardioides sp. YR527 TaxID=1881028 RepID=UPI00088ACDD3|nr:ABC transporter substrate-binding protein [Nocardioides sp. YR527]SDL04215.1 iron complex transport system substrate-binding protein [Nocardioides sp. YR527]